MSGEEQVAAIRAGYQSFNGQDLDGVLAILAEDVQWPDVVENTVLRGKEAVRQYLERVFSVTTPRVTLGDVIPIGVSVVATTYQQFYDLYGKPLGLPRLAVNRFTFRGDLVSRMEVTSHDEIPDQVRRRYRGVSAVDE